MHHAERDGNDPYFNMFQLTIKLQEYIETPALEDYNDYGMHHLGLLTTKTWHLYDIALL